MNAALRDVQHTLNKLDKEKARRQEIEKAVRRHHREVTHGPAANADERLWSTLDLCRMPLAEAA